MRKVLAGKPKPASHAAYHAHAALEDEEPVYRSFGGEEPVYRSLEDEEPVYRSLGAVTAHPTATGPDIIAVPSVVVSVESATLDRALFDRLMSTIA